MKRGKKNKNHNLLSSIPLRTTKLYKSKRSQKLLSFSQLLKREKKYSIINHKGFMMTTISMQVTFEYRYKKFENNKPFINQISKKWIMSQNMKLHPWFENQTSCNFISKGEFSTKEKNNHKLVNIVQI